MVGGVRAGPWSAAARGFHVSGWMCPSSIQTGWRAAPGDGPWGAASVAAARGAQKSDCGRPAAAGPGVVRTCVEETVPANGNPSPVRPFWQYLEDSNNRDRLERAAERGASSRCVEQGAMGAGRGEAARGAVRAAAGTEMPMPPERVQSAARAAYVTREVRVRAGRVMDVMA